jgi:nitroreductase
MLYEAIFQRKSVRKYKRDDIEEALLHNIKLKIETLKPLFEDIGYEIKILRREEVSNNWAPSYIAIYSEKKPGYLLNAGYLLQQIDLFVQSIGLGSCWIGLARPHLSKQKRYGFVIMLSVGYPEQDISRTKEDFKRKTLLEITDIEDSNLMEAVRLAPSAVNSQPWD